jgi:FAD/FMN-containing dehydrogenase
MGGGHATCPGFSSTKGIHIRMSCLNDIEFFNDNRLVQAGAGCTWDEIYKAVDAKGRIIVGGASDRGVGIAGYLLGGGYSMKTNQYGLGIDNVTEFEVALPNGNCVIANKNNNKDLFEALRVCFSFTIIEPHSHRFAIREVGITSAS